MVEIGRFIRAGDAAFNRPAAAEHLHEVERGAPIVARHAVVVKAQRGDKLGAAVAQTIMVFHIQGDVALAGFAAAPCADTCEAVGAPLVGEALHHRAVVV